MIGLLLLLSCIASEAYTVLQPKTTPAYNALKRQTDKFSWQKQWYAVAVPEYLDEKRPHKIQILDEHYVLWFDRAHQEWSALSDACPHRRAPLSEGIVQPDGTLLCAYHAWRFNKSGQCVDIPQSLKFDKTSHCSSTRACAKSFPVQEKQGVLFLWPQSGLEALRESQVSQPSTVPDLDDKELMESGRVTVLPLNFRTLPYGFETFFENVLDPAHAVVSHHKIIGNRYTDTAPLRSRLTEFNERQISAKYNTVKLNNTLVSHAINDWHVGHLLNRIQFSDGAQMLISSYASPMTAGKSLFVGNQILIQPNSEQKIPKQASHFHMKVLPIWLQHTMLSLVLHQDHMLLHKQEINLANAGVNSTDFASSIYSPNGQDNMVLWFKKWMSQRDALWSGVLRTKSEQEVFDVYSTHTKDCKYCKAADSNLKKVIIGLRLCTGISLVFGISNNIYG